MILAMVSLLMSASVARSQVVTLNQNFEGTSAPGWVFGTATGSGINSYTPVLTANQGASPGWLELTNGQTNEATYAYDTTSFASSNVTIAATFNYVSFNGTGADGLTFFLADASVVAASGFSPGAYGGSLGYAQKTGISGLSGGYLGIGIDEYGNYSNPTEGRVGGTGFIANAIAVRGPGSGTSGYNYLGGTGSLATPLTYPGQTTMPTGSEAETIQMVLTATNQLTVSVEFGNSGVFVPEFTANLSGYTRPQNLILGFTAGTGSLTSTQEIQQVSLSAVAANIWNNASGTDSNWGTATNWVGGMGVQPTQGADVLLNNSAVSGPQSINVNGTEVIRSLQIDSPSTYTLSNGTLEFNMESNTGQSGIIVTNTNGQTTQTINSAVQADNAIVISNNTLGTLNLGGGINTGLGNSVSFTGSGVVNETGVISSSGSIDQTGTGTTTLSGNNTYTGGTAVTAGTLVANNNNALGTGTVSLYGGTLSSTNSSSISNAVALLGNATLSGLTSSGTMTQTGSNTLVLQNVTQSGNVVLSTSGTQTLTTEVDSGTSTISGVVSDGGTGSGLTKTGAGTLVLGSTSNASTYTGATTVNAGTLQLGGNNVINSASAVNLTNSTLNLAGYSDSVGVLTFNNSTINFAPNTGATNTLLVNNISGSSTGVLTILGWQQSSGTSTYTYLEAATAGIASSILNNVYFAGYGSGAVEAGSTNTVGSYTGYQITPNTTFLTWNGTASTKAGGTQTWNDLVTQGSANYTNWVAGVPSTTPGSTQKVDFTGTTGLAPVMQANYSVNALKFDTAAGSSSAGFNINLKSGYTNYTLTMSGAVPSIIQQSAYGQTISNGTINWNASNGTGVIDVSGAGTLTIGSNMTGTNTIDKLSAGTLALSGTNSGFTGAIDIQGGIISASGNNSPLGTGAVTVASGASLQGTGANETFTNAITATGTGATGNGAIDAEMTSGNKLTLTGNVTLGGNTTFNAGTGSTLAVNTTGQTITGSGSTLTLTGAGAFQIANIQTGTGGLTLNGTGTTTLTGTNTYTGTTTANSGTLDLNAAIAGNLTLNGGTVTDGGSTNLASTANLAVNSGTFNLAGYTESINDLSGIPGGTVGLGSGTLNVVGTGASTFGGSLTGTGSLNNSGTGELILTGSSGSFTGTVGLTNGVIIAGATNASGGTGSSVNVSSTGNFEIQGNSTLASSFTLSTTGASTGNGAVENLSGNNQITGGVTLGANSRIQSDSGTLSVGASGSGNTVATGTYTLNVGGTGNTTFNEAITGSGSITKDGTGTMALAKASSAYTGSVAVNAGTLQAGAASALSGASSITVASGATLQSTATGGLTTAATVNVSSGGTFDLNSTTGSTLTNMFTDSGALNFGTGGALTLNGSGKTDTLSGTITGSGTLTIGAGQTLVLGASFNDPGLNIVMAGGTLKVLGTNDYFGSLTVNSSSTIDFGTPSAASGLDVSSISFNGTSPILTVSNWVNTVDYFYSTANPGTSVSQITFTGQGAVHWNTYPSGPDNDHQITPAPEPSTYGVILVGLSMAGLVLHRRRQARA